MQKAYMSKQVFVFRVAAFFAVFQLILVTLTGCADILDGFADRTPPTKDALEDYFQEHRKDILFITEYLINQDGSVFVDYDGDNFESWFDVHIPDDIRNAIMRLRQNQRICIGKSENTIRFIIWIPPISEIESGIALSINGTDTPEIQYATVITPMTEPGWYYFVSDFNTWRVEQRQVGTQGTVCVNPTEK